MPNTKKILCQAHAAVSCLLVLQLQESYIKNGSKKKRTLWSRKWLLRRNAGRGTASLVLNELAIEDPTGFRNFARMAVQTCEVLLLKVGGQLERQNTVLRECISAKIRLIVTLHFLATEETYQSLSYFRISTPSLSLVIAEIVDTIYTLLKKDYLKTPSTREEWKGIAKAFYKLWNFLMRLGALDGKHIAFRAKKSDGSFYYNYKGFHSIVLLALVDAEYNFIYVNAGCNGRVSDGGVFSQASLSKAIERNAFNFPDDDYLPGTSTKVLYVLVAGEAFKDINLPVEKVKAITFTCCTLHNFIKSRDGNKYFQGIDQENIATGTFTEGECRQHVFLTPLERKTANRSSNDSIHVRNQFTKYFNKAGAVSWQENTIE